MAFTDKALKSKANLTFAEAPIKDKTCDLHNTEPKQRKQSNRSLSGNPFGERFVTNSTAKDVRAAP